MKKIYFILICICFFTNAYSQIISQDTICVGSPDTFSTPVSAVVYAWMFDSVNINQTASTLSTIYSGGFLSTPTFSSFNYDDGSYYTFITNYNSNEIIKLSYGNSPNNTPTAIDLGSFGLSGGIAEGIDVAFDTIANTWFGLVVDGSQMLLLNFGNSLSNTPTGSIMNYPLALFWPHQVTIKNYNGQWIAFVGNRNASIERFDFGSSLLNTPTASALPMAGGIYTPCDFCLYEQSGNWYMLVTDLVQNNLTRYDLGTDLQNDNPTADNLGDPGSLLSLPRSVSIITNCNGQLFAYITNETGHIIKLDFQGDITSTPIPSDFGNFGSTLNSLTPYIYNNTMYFLLLSYGSDLLSRFEILNLPAPTIVNYYTSSAIQIFTTTGIHHVTLFCDQGMYSGPSAFCKDIVVVADSVITTTKDTSICQGSTIILNSSVNGIDYTWSTGDTTSSISVSQSGTYWVTILEDTCKIHVDTFHINVFSAPVISLNNISSCQGDTVALGIPLTTGITYLWNTGATTDSIKVTTSGAYWLKITNTQGCSATDTVHVTFNTNLIVSLGDDTSICQGNELTLQSSYSYTNASYQWNTGSTNSSIQVSQSGDYWLTVTQNGCSGSDTVMVTVHPVPAIAITGNTFICSGQSEQLNASGADSAYIWSPSAGLNNANISDPVANVNSTITYTVTGIDTGGCSAKKPVTITVYAAPVIKITGDTGICMEQYDQLNASGADSAYIWSPSTGLSNANISDPVANINSTTTYIVTGIDSGGCSGSATFKVTVYNYTAPIINITGNTSVCYGQYDQLNASGAVTYSWLPSDYITNSTIADPLVHPIASTTYIVTGTDGNGCIGTDSIHIDVRPLPVLTATSSGTVTCSDTAVQVSASGAVSYVWGPAEYVVNNNIHSQDPFVSPLGNTMFWVTGTDEYGCSNIDSVLVSSDKAATVFVPNAFTPNNDGLNDVIYPNMSCDLVLDLFSVYNRWGQRVFTTSTEHAGWNGVFNGVPQDTGTFGYYVKAHRISNGKTVFFKGDFTLIR